MRQALTVRGMDGYVMTVRFERTEDGTCRVTARARDRRPFAVSHMAAGAGLPHDLATFAVERALGLPGGFFNMTAHGAVFRSSGRRRTRPGRAVVLANREALEDAERVVHEHQDRWARGLPTPAGTALREAAERWSALAPGQAFEEPWPRLPLPVRPDLPDRDRPAARRGPPRGRSARAAASR